MEQMLFDYHYGMEAEQYAFFRIPKVLITDPHFKSISTDAKLLYGLMLDRMSLSVKNGWMDENERVYIYFTLDEVCEQLCCKTDKAVKLFSELDTGKGVGLIERIRQGQGRPSRIYVMRFVGTEDTQTSANAKSRLRKNRSQELGKSEVLTTEKPSSTPRKKRGQDFGKTEGSNNKINNTDFSKTDLSIYPAQSAPEDVIEEYREEIKDIIEYDFLKHDFPYDDIDEIVDLMLEVFCTQGDFVKIGTKQVYTALVKERFRKLTSEHIRYIIDNMEDNPSDIRNIKAYLLECLFNAPATIGNHYKAKVNHDFRSTG